MRSGCSGRSNRATRALKTLWTDRPYLFKLDVQFCVVAVGSIFLAVERHGDIPGRNESDAVVWLCIVDPVLHQLGDVDYEVMILGLLGDFDIAHIRNSKRWQVVALERVFIPQARYPHYIE